MILKILTQSFTFALFLIVIKTGHLMALPQCSLGKSPNQWNNCLGSFSIQGVTYKGIWKNGSLNEGTLSGNIPEYGKVREYSEVLKITCPMDQER